VKVEELVLLIDLLDKLGYNAETAGTRTVFQRLAQIANYVDTLEAKLGLNTDAAGTGTVFARLAQIAGYTDAVESLIGAANPTASGTNTLFNYLKKIEDAVILKSYQTSVYYSQNDGVYRDIVNISGQGIMKKCKISGTSASYSTNDGGHAVRYRIYIDGSLYKDVGGNGVSKGVLDVFGNCFDSFNYRDYESIHCNLPFKSSFRLKAAMYYNGSFTTGPTFNFGYSMK